MTAAEEQLVAELAEAQAASRIRAVVAAAGDQP